MMDETQAQKALADATAPPKPGPGQLVDPPEVAWYAQRGDPPISEWPGRAVTRKDRSLPKKQRHTAKRIYERPRAEHGFDGKYTLSSFERLASPGAYREWHRDRGRELGIQVAGKGGAL